MTQPQLLIVGGGLAGLSAGCYARASGYATTIIEHNLALGGVCAAWLRGPYTIDGCIHWLTGGKFEGFYRELGILPAVGLHVLEEFFTYRNPTSGVEVSIRRDLRATAAALEQLAPADILEIRRIFEAADTVAELDPGFEQPPELQSFADRMHQFWSMRHELAHLAHFRKPFGQYADEHIQTPALRRVLARLTPETAPAFFLLMVLGYLGRGYLSRPDGGTAAFRDRLVHVYGELGGEARVHATVDEILVENGRACGVRLADGTLVRGDRVLSTSSLPETVLRLLGGRYGAPEVRDRLEHWKLFPPIVLVSFGVAAPFRDVPPTLHLEGVPPFDAGGRQNDELVVRTFNDDPSIAPAGHTVVQVMFNTEYDWWATRGARYQAEKDAIAERSLAAIEPHFPGIRQAVRVTDVATPLTFWRAARSWRGAYEGWMPVAGAGFGHVKKTLPGLADFYMAGQWVEPGGGVPIAIMSGRQVVQLLCADDKREFRVPVAA